MSSNIASTQFATGPDDDLATVDVYTANEATDTNGSGKGADGVVRSPLADDPAKNVDTAVSTASGGGTEANGQPISGNQPTSSSTSSTPEIKGEEQSALSSALSDDLTQSAIDNMLKPELKDIKPKKQPPRKRLNGVASPVDDAMRELDDKRVQRLLKTVDGDGTTNAMRADIGSVTRIINTADVGSATGVTKLLKNIAGNDVLVDILDVGAQAAMIEAALDIAMDWNIPGIIDTILGEKYHKRDVEAALLRSFPGAVRSSNFNMAHEIVDRLSVQRCRTALPTVVTDVFRYFKIPRDMQQKDWQGHMDEGIRLMRRFDANFETTQRDGEDVRDLSVFCTASKMARTLLQQREDFRVYSMTGQNYRQMSIKLTARIVFPNAPISGI